MTCAVLDKIIGSSPLSRSTFSMHHGSATCAFASGGFVSLLSVGQKQRNDFSIAGNSSEIDALAFSPNGRQLAVGTKGPNARLYLLSFNDRFDTITDRVEMRTKENGFSGVAVDAGLGKLLSVGSDPSPFIILWDTKLSKPEPVGYYHLAVRPNHCSIAPNGKFAIVSGPKLLKLIDLSPAVRNEPVSLNARNLNIGKFKASNYVASFSSPNQKEAIYALTDEGVLLAYDKQNAEFTKKTSISCSRIILDCGPTQAMSVDAKIVLVGNNAGTMIAIKCDGPNHTIIGKFSADGHPILAVACSERIVGGAYNNGQILFFPRRPDRPPVFSLPLHRGPICSICVSNDDDEKFVYSGGSDGTLRKWEVIKHQELVSGSSQSQVAAKKISRLQDDFMTSLRGVRCVATKNSFVFAGDNYGFLYMLKAENLSVIEKISENSRGTISIALHPSQKILASGGIDGMIRLYSYTDTKMTNIISDQTHTSPVTSITFTSDYIISSSKEGIRFASLPAAEPFKTAKVDDLPLSLVTLPNKRFVVSCGMNSCVSIWRVNDGSLFRRYTIAQDSVTTAVDVDKTGMFLAVGMSDTTVHIVDIFSGNIIVCFKSISGMITSIHWQQNDIIISGMTGCISRWTMPECIYKAIADKMKSNLPLDLILNDEKEDEPETSILLSPSRANRLVSSSTIKSGEMEPNWMFQEIKDDQGKEEAIEDEEGEEENEQEAFFDAPRPLFGMQEKRADDIIRASFSKHNNDDNEIDDSPSNSTKDSVMDIINCMKKKKEEENKDFIVLNDSQEKPKQKHIIDVDADVPSIIKGLDDNDLDPFVIIDDLGKDTPPSSPKKQNDIKRSTTPEQTETKISLINVSDINKNESNHSLPLNASNPNEPQIEVPVKVQSPVPSDDSQASSGGAQSALSKSPETQASIPQGTPQQLTKSEEIKQISRKLTELLAQADELLALETTNEGELNAIASLKQVRDEIQRSALKSKWLKESFASHFNQFFSKL